MLAEAVGPRKKLEVGLLLPRKLAHRPLDHFQALPITRIALIGEATSYGIPLRYRFWVTKVFFPALDVA